MTTLADDPAAPPQSLDAPDTDDLMAGLKELDDNRKAYERARDYFTGDVPEFFASPRLRRMLARTGTSFRLNVAKKAVTAVTDRLEIAAVTVPDSETLSTVLHDQVWQPNELSLEAPDVHQKTCEFGDGYVFVWPNDDGGVDVEWSGPISTRAIYDPEHPRRISYVVKRWLHKQGQTRDGRSKEQFRANLYYFGDGDADDPTGRIEKWISTAGTSATDAEHWLPYTDDPDDGGQWPLPNPYGQTVFHFRTGRPYGTALHKDAYGPQDALNKITITHMSTIDYHGAPQRYALTDPDADADDDADDWDDDEDFPQEALASRYPDREGKSKLRTGPGEAWILHGMKEVGQFDAADPDAFLKPADFYLRMMSTATDTPLHFYDPGGDQPSGDARRTAEGTLTKKVDQLQLSFESTWSACLSCAMRMLGYGEVVRVDVRWSPAQVIDDLEGWQTATAKIGAGVPIRQVLLEAGYTVEQVDGWLATTDEQDIVRRVQMAAQIAAMTRDFGTGMQLGSIAPETVQKITDGLMPTNGTGGQ